MTAGLDSSFDLAALSQWRQQVAAAPSGKDATQLQAAARQFESLFTQMLLKSMRAAGESFKDSASSSQQSDFYQDMFDQQLALHLSKGRGLGLAQMLIEQLGRGQLAQGEVQERSLQPAAVTTAAVNGSGRWLGNTSSATSAAVQSGRAAVATQGAAGASADTDTRHQFVRQLWPHAQQAAQALGVDPHAVLAQSVLETGWGRHVPQSDSRSSHNLFGIKAHAWQGSSVTATTREYESGVAVKRSERFRAYESAQDSVDDYVALLTGHSRYAPALAAGRDIAGFAAGLQRAGYATDPQYASKLIALAGQLRRMTGELALQAATPATQNEPVASGAQVASVTTSHAIVAAHAQTMPAVPSHASATAALKSLATAPLSPDSPSHSGEWLMARGPGGS